VDDRLADAKEAIENVIAAEEALAKINLQIADIQASVMLHDFVSILYCCVHGLSSLRV
jgi:hypothetical protein